MGTSKSPCTAALSLALLVVLTAPDLGADEPFLVRDIVPGIGGEFGSDPFLMSVGDQVFLFATEEDHGREVWITDGTPEGTELIRDVCPGRCSSEPKFVWPLGDRLVFTARAVPREQPFPTFQHRLWASDGTFAGTRALRTPLIVDPNVGSPIVDAPVVGELEDRGLFFFEVTDFEPPRDRAGLWVTDGTPVGTRGPLGLEGPDGPLRSVSGVSIGREALVFRGSAPATGGEPWITDGTEQGTRLIADLIPGPDGAAVGSFQRLANATLFFTSNFVSASCETTLWRSDGTAPGTVPLVDFETEGCSESLGFVRRVDDAIFFSAKTGTEATQAWTSDGTAAGTRQLTSFSQSVIGDSFTAASDDAVLFGVDDGVHGFEPWIADAAGARILGDLCPGPCPSGPWFPQWLDGRFYFHADDGVHGIEPWRSDGTAGGTGMIQDICAGECDSFEIGFGFTAVGGRVFFRAQQESGGEREQELWATPAQGEGAVRLTDFDLDFPFVASGRAPFSTAAVGDLYLFTAIDSARGYEIWQSDGTPEGTRLAANLETRRAAGAGSDPVLFTPWEDGVLFFAHEPEVSYQPWISDGTEGGTRRLGIVADPDQQSSAGRPYFDPVVLGADALFLARLGFDGPLELWRVRESAEPMRLAELASDLSVIGTRMVRLGGRAVAFVEADSAGDDGVWSSDGTATGTRRLLQAAISYSGDGELGGKLYFGAAHPTTGEPALWATDGTEAGTTPVVSLGSGSFGTFPSHFTRLGGLLLFAADHDTAGVELWRSDGTAAGTRLVADLMPGDSSHPRSLTTASSRAFFFANGASGQREVWASDGTAEGTVRLGAAPHPVIFPPVHSIHAAAGERFFFVTSESPTGRNDLWMSNGTLAGTGSLRPLLPPTGNVIGVWSAGDRVRVLISEPDDFGSGPGSALWETDGTLAGTRRLLEGHITEFAEAGPLLFFQGPHPEAGSEPMALVLGPPGPCAADAETLCLGGGRFAVRVRWRDPRTGDEGGGGALPFPGSDRTGMFWFFHPDNVELVVKNLDGGPVNGWFWNFYGGLSDVEYRIEVVDTATGRRVEYHNPEGEICGRGDTTAFLSREPVPLPVPPQMPAPAVAAAPAPGTGSACGGGPGALCLLDGRFRVEVEWTDQRSGDSGIGTAVAGTDRSGFFWFFNQSNIELVVKMLDGRQVNGRFWVFYGALSDVAYTITVTDTETGTHKEYRHPPGEICGRGDTAAF
jgi:ELWxxDGT repeat protein